MSDRDSFLDFTDGDAEAARMLRRNLATLADRVDDKGLREDIRAVLAGRMAFRELTGDPRLQEIARAGSTPSTTSPARISTALGVSSGPTVTLQQTCMP